MKNTNSQIDTTDNGVLADTSRSLRAGPRGFDLLEDTTVRKKMLHFDRERAPERVVHALGHGAYGQFESYGDWRLLDYGLLVETRCDQRGLHTVLCDGRQRGRE